MLKIQIIYQKIHKNKTNSIQTSLSHRQFSQMTQNHIQSRLHQPAGTKGQMTSSGFLFFPPFLPCLPASFFPPLSSRLLSSRSHFSRHFSLHICSPVFSFRRATTFSRGWSGQPRLKVFFKILFFFNILKIQIIYQNIQKNKTNSFNSIC